MAPDTKGGLEYHPGDDSGTWRYRAFISYSHQDRAWGGWLHRALESYRVPARLVGKATSMGIVPARIVPVFRDREELPTAHHLGAVITSALEGSATLVVICSPAAARSRWVNEEILTFKRLGRAERILCLIVAGEPNASDQPASGLEECFPAALRFKLGPDGELSGEREEPVAADLRPTGDGRTSARLKLIAGILGVGLDELRQRDQQRKQRRLVAVSAASLAGMLLAGLLALNAVAARKDAERSREKAEELVGFMLGDLTHKLRAVGRLDVFDAINEQVLSYFESLTAKDLTSRTLAQRANALTQVGEIAFDHGDLEGATRAFSQSVAQARLLASREPESATSQNQLANSELWLGFAYWQRGDLDASLEHFRLALAAADRAHELAPGDVEILATRASAHSNTAQVLERRGELAAARQEYEIVLDLQQQLVRDDPGNPEWQAELGFAHNTLGKVELRLGHMDAARQHYARDLELKRALVAGDPTHRLWQRYLAMSEGFMAEFLELAGDHAGAVAHVERATTLGRQLVEIEPEHVLRRRFLARMQMRRARLARMEADLALATGLLTEAQATLRELVAMDPADVDHRGSLAEAHLAMAETLAGVGRHEAAIAECLAGLSILEDAAAADAANVAARVELARGELVIARLYAADGKPEVAQHYFAAAGARLETAGITSSEPAVLHARTAALAGLQDFDGARALAERLLEMGYRQPDFTALARSIGVASDET
jgi:eukaryotic-like serine/threonine-protein kinase